MRVRLPPPALETPANRLRSRWTTWWHDSRKREGATQGATSFGFHPCFHFWNARGTCVCSTRLAAASRLRRKSEEGAGDRVRRDLVPDDAPVGRETGPAAVAAVRVHAVDHQHERPAARPTPPPPMRRRQPTRPTSIASSEPRTSRSRTNTPSKTACSGQLRATPTTASMKAATESTARRRRNRGRLIRRALAAADVAGLTAALAIPRGRCRLPPRPGGLRSPLERPRTRRLRPSAFQRGSCSPACTGSIHAMRSTRTRRRSTTTRRVQHGHRRNLGRIPRREGIRRFSRAGESSDVLGVRDPARLASARSAVAAALSSLAPHAPARERPRGAGDGRANVGGSAT
jgi:hypothetical protein